MVIYASNIHVTGGKVLLEDLLNSIAEPCILFAHSKFVVAPHLLSRVTVISVKPSILQRVLAEWKLKQISKDHRVILCFGNLPPLFSISGKTILFFQNTILFRNKLNLNFSTKVKIKHAIERLWLRWGIRHIDEVFVQSEEMRSGFRDEFPNAKVKVAPFIGLMPKLSQAADSQFDFVYVASADPHKNQSRLLKAWHLLSQDGLFPSLALTFNTAPESLKKELAELQNKGLKITNVTELPRNNVFELYTKSRALIFPSLTESFGMPLLEAQSLGLPILASELDYVREFVTPVQTFDPLSEKSIYRAVKRHLLGASAEAHQKVLSPEEFLRLLNS